ncbi:MAG: hypothetical protein ACE5GB_06825 [Acidimicrobiales bacterium]
MGRGYHTREVETFGAPLLDQEANREMFEEQVEIIGVREEKRGASARSRWKACSPMASESMTPGPAMSAMVVSSSLLRAGSPSITAARPLGSENSPAMASIRSCLRLGTVRWSFLQISARMSLVMAY